MTMLYGNLEPAAGAAAKTDAQQTDVGGGEYEPVEGRDRQTIECERACEAVASKNTANAYSHIVWAYGVIWALFCIYGVMLWRRGLRIEADVRALQKRIDASR